jgi:transmembrane sensor
MNYENYSADDLIKDEAFQQWVFSPTEEGNRFWLMFLQDHPGHRERVEEARQFLSVFNVRDKDVFESRINNLKRRIDHAIDQPESTAHQPLPETVNLSPKRPRHRVLIKIAASVSIVFLAAFLIFYYYVYSSSSHEQITTASSRLQEQVTTRGKRTMIHLADGSTVWLNADSRLEYPEHFKDRQNREVSLGGEAFFEITAKDKPFLVTASDITVRTLGASFNITSYAAEERVEITLVKGKATLESTSQKLNQVTLASGQKAVFEKRSGRLMLENQANTAKSTSWKNGLLILEDQPFTEIKTILERWYDVTIHVSDESAMRCRFSAEIDNKTLEEALELLTPAGTIAFRREGKELFITGKICQQQP